MPEFDKKKIFSWVTIKLPVLVLIILFFSAIIIGYFFFTIEQATKVSMLLGGLLTGVVIVIIQFCFGWAEYKAISNIQALGVKNVLNKREGREYYQNLIEKSEDRIYVMGVTANRFMDHFASESGDSNSKVLFQALNRGVEVRILVPSKEHLYGRDRKKANMVSETFQSVSEGYKKFEYRYFDHLPTHSIFVVDNECILGPVFPNLESRFTPAIQISAESEFAIKYLDYFDREWLSAKE